LHEQVIRQLRLGDGRVGWNPHEGSDDDGISAGSKVSITSASALEGAVEAGPSLVHFPRQELSDCVRRVSHRAAPRSRTP
jgi:hypothetical protein